MAIELIVPSGINVIAFVNETLVGARRRGFDGEVTLPSMRERARAVVHEERLMKVQSSAATVAVGEFSP